MLDRLRPHPHRGDLIAAGAVPLTVAIAMIDVRFDGEWGSGIFLVIEGLAAGLILGMGLLAKREEEYPRAYQTILLVAGLTLFLGALMRLAEVLGADDPLGSAGTVTWIAAVFTAVAAVPAWEKINSPICAFIEVVAGGVTVLAFVDWVFDPESVTTFRWLLLFLVLVYSGAHLRWRSERPRHAVYMVDAAGLATIALAATFGESIVAYVISPENAVGNVGTWWEIVLLGLGLGLIAYAAADRAPGPAYLGFVALSLFEILAGLPGEDGASLIGWPLLLVLLGGAAVAAGLRPIRPLPPPPDAGAPPAETQVLQARPDEPRP